MSNAMPLKPVTGVVARLRWVMLCSICFLVGAVALSLLLGREDDRLRLSYSSLEHKSGNLPPVMIKPQLQGVDGQGQPFQVSAEEAMQPDSNSVVLQRVAADLTAKDGTWLSLSADMGDLDMEASMLQLSKNVKLYHDAGYEFATNSAIVEMEQATAWGNKPVTMNGPLGTLRAQGFQLYQEPARMVFLGRVHLTLYPSTQNE